MSEISTDIYNKFQVADIPVKKYIEVEVFGLEDCKLEGAGGFCTSEYRNTKN